jgi:hypothetical protein
MQGGSIFLVEHIAEFCENGRMSRVTIALLRMLEVMLGFLMRNFSQGSL